MVDQRRALLVAALAALQVKSREPELVGPTSDALQVKSREPELAMVHAWLDSWSGFGPTSDAEEVSSLTTTSLSE